ncbi:MAG: tetratricopeptide repeat protein, partial [Flavobacteriales bacterium]
MRKLTCSLLLLVSFYFGKSHAQKTIQQGYDCLENKDFGSAERAFRKGVSKYPQQAYFGLAKLYFESKDVGNLDSALTNVERSLRLLGNYEDLTNGNTKDGKVNENNSDLSLFVYRLLLDYKEQVLWKYLTQLKASSTDWLNVEKIMPYVHSDLTLESYKRLRDS